MRVRFDCVMGLWGDCVAPKTADAYHLLFHLLLLLSQSVEPPSMQRVCKYSNSQAETEHDLYLFALLLAACAKLTNPPQRNR